MNNYENQIIIKVNGNTIEDEALRQYLLSVKPQEGYVFTYHPFNTIISEGTKTKKVATHYQLVPITVNKVVNLMAESWNDKFKAITKYHLSYPTHMIDPRLPECNVTTVIAVH